MNKPELSIQTPEVFLPLLGEHMYKGAKGGRGCVHGDTLIDTPSGQVKVSEFSGGEVYSYSDGRLVIGQGLRPERYSVEDLYEVEFEDGRSIIVTDEHRFLTPFGWMFLKDLSVSDCCVLRHCESFSFLRERDFSFSLLGLRQGVLRYLERLLSCLGGYFAGFRRYDQRLRLAADNALIFLPLQGDVERHIHRALFCLDGLGFSHICSFQRLLFGLLSSHDVHGVLGGRNCINLGNCISERFSELLLEFSRWLERFHVRNSHFLPFPEFSGRFLAGAHLKCLDENFQRVSDIQFFDVGGNYSSCSDAVLFKGDDFFYSRIKKISHHSRDYYWDLHVLVHNNYLSNGIVNHNSGKSWQFCSLIVEDMLRGHVRAVGLREYQSSIRESVKLLIEDTIRRYGVEDQFDITEQEIRGPHGSFMVFRGMNSVTEANVKSLEGFNRAFFEEAQTMSQRSLDLLIPTIRSNDAQLMFAWNPYEDDDPIEVFFRENAGDSDFVCVHANYLDNPFCSEKLLKDAERDRKRDYDKYCHVWLGEYRSQSEAQVFKNWVVEDFETPEGVEFLFGADWGFSKDPAILVRCFVVGDKLYIDREVVEVGCEMNHLPALFAGDDLRNVPEHERWGNPKCHAGIPGAFDWMIKGDSARPETISYMNGLGFNIVPARKGFNSIKEGVKLLQNFDIIVHKRCKHTEKELKRYSYKVDKKTGKVTAKLQDNNNHVIDSLRYALEDYMGGDRLFEYNDGLVCDPVDLPKHWARVSGLHIDRQVSCLWGAVCPETRVMYLYGEYVVPRGELAIHADAIRSKGKWIPCLFNHLAGRNKAEGLRIVDRLIDLNVDLYTVQALEEPSVDAISQMVSSGRLKVFNTLPGFISQYRSHKRDSKGRIVDQVSGLIDACGLLCLYGGDMAVDEGRVSVDSGGSSYYGGADSITGY